MALVKSSTRPRTFSRSKMRSTNGGRLAMPYAQRRVELVPQLACMLSHIHVGHGVVLCYCVGRHHSRFVAQLNLTMIRVVRFPRNLPYQSIARSVGQTKQAPAATPP